MSIENEQLKHKKTDVEHISRPPVVQQGHTGKGLINDEKLDHVTLHKI